MVDRPEFLVAVNKPYELFLDLEGEATADVFKH